MKETRGRAAAAAASRRGRRQMWLAGVTALEVVLSLVVIWPGSHGWTMRPALLVGAGTGLVVVAVIAGWAPGVPWGCAAVRAVGLSGLFWAVLFTTPLSRRQPLPLPLAAYWAIYTGLSALVMAGVQAGVARLRGGRRPPPPPGWARWRVIWGNAGAAAVVLLVGVALAVRIAFPVGVRGPVGRLVLDALSEAIWGLAAWWAWRRAGRPWSLTWRAPAAVWGRGAVTGLGLLLVQSAVAVGVAHLLHEPPPSNVSGFVAGMPRPLWSWLGVIVVGAAPVAETLLFQGVLQPALTEAAGRPVGILGTAVLFSVLHEVDVATSHAWLWAVILPAGLGLAWLRDRTRGLAAPTAAHAILNGIAWIAFWLGRGS